MIRNQDRAIQEVMIPFFRNQIKNQIININKGRHRFVKTEIGNYLVIYKREFFHSFSKIYPDVLVDYPDFSKEGESINKESLDFAMKNDVRLIIFAHPRKTYCLAPIMIERFCTKYNSIRTQDKSNIYLQKGGKYAKENETTYSFSRSLLNEFNEDTIKWQKEN